MAVEITDEGKTILVVIDEATNGYAPQEHSFIKTQIEGLNIDTKQDLFSIESSTKLIRLPYAAISVPASADVYALRNLIEAML